MKHPLLKTSFLIPIALFTIHQLLQKVLYFNITPLDNYLDPFCLGAIITPILSFERKIIFNQNPLNLIEIVVLFTILAIASEIVIPYFFNNFISDPWDVLFLAIGFIWFLAWSSLEKKELKTI